MTKILLNLGVVITLLCVSCELAAQSDIALATRKAELQELSKNLQKRDENNRRQAQEFRWSTAQVFAQIYLIIRQTADW